MPERIVINDPEEFLCIVNEELINFIGLTCGFEKPLTLAEIKKAQKDLKKIHFPEERMIYEDYIENAWEKIELAYDCLTENEVTRKTLKDFREEADNFWNELTSLFDPDAMEESDDHIEFKAVIDI